MPTPVASEYTLLITPRKIQRGLFFFLFFFLFPLFYLGCSEDPSSLGLGLLPTQDLVRLDTATVTSATGTSVRKFINTGSSRNLLVGKTLGYEAKALLKFHPIPDTLKGVIVRSAELVLRPSYRFGERQNLLSFTVHRITQGWTEFGVTWDSVTARFSEPVARGRFSRVIADTDSVVVRLDTGMVRNWLQIAGSETIEGIVLLPSGESNTIVGFHSFQDTASPRLDITYLKAGAESKITLVSGQDAHVANVENLVADPNLLYVQAGVVYRAQLTFSFAGIPQHAGIHQATLELTLNRPASKLTPKSVDSLFAFYRVTEDSVATGSAALGKRLDPNSDVYTFTITQYVQRWVSGRTNLGLQIEPMILNSTLDLFTFYSSTAHAAVRPRVKIVYSRSL